jgi:hypothetical protein
MANLAAVYQQPDEQETHEAWVNEFAKAIQQNDKGAYVNFLADVDEAQVRAAYPGSRTGFARSKPNMTRPIYSISTGTSRVYKRIRA